MTFAEQLAGLSSTLLGDAVLESLDGYLEVTLTGDGLGHVTVSGQAWDHPRYGSHLDFMFSIDQTFLPGIETSLDELLEELGTPGRP